MDIGRLRHPIEIEAFTMTQDPNTGAVVEEWAVIGQDWAAIEGVSGREFIASQAGQSETTYRVTLRYRPDLTPKMRLKNTGDSYKIKAILPDNHRRFLTCMCEVLE